MRELTAVQSKSEGNAVHLLCSGEIMRTEAKHSPNRSCNTSHCSMPLHTTQMQVSGVCACERGCLCVNSGLLCMHVLLG